MNIYQKYKVKFNSNGSIKNFDGEFKDFTEEHERVVTGGELFRIFSLNLSSSGISEVKYEKTKSIIKLTFEFFHPLTGEGETSEYELVEVEE